MKKLIITIILIITSLLQTVSAEMVVVINEKNSIESLSKSEVIDIYMGRHTKFSNGVSAMPVDQQKNSSLQQIFYKQLIGKSLAKVNAYWARLTFTGRAKPPKTINDSANIELFVQTNIGAIGYMDNKDIDTRLKVVFRFEDF